LILEMFISGENYLGLGNQVLMAFLMFLGNACMTDSTEDVDIILSTFMFSGLNEVWQTSGQ